MIPSSGLFANLRRSFLQLAASRMTWLWVLIILGIQLLVAVVGGPNQEPAWSWYAWLGLSRDGVLAGKIWQLMSYGFLHGNGWHVGANALFLILVGSRVEHMVGTSTLAIVIILGVLGGGLAHVMLAPGGENAPLLVGISGGCIGLLLVMTTLSPQSRMMPLPVSAKSLGIGVLVAEVVLALANPALQVPGFVRLGNWLVGHGMSDWFLMGHACHFGGGLAGWLCGRWLLRPRVNLERLRRDRVRREAKADQTRLK